jgi:hypothetical protein
MPQSWDMGQIILLPHRRHAEEFFHIGKNPTASVGFEPANSGTRGQHANHQSTEAVERERERQTDNKVQGVFHSQTHTAVRPIETVQSSLVTVVVSIRPGVSFKSVIHFSVYFPSENVTYTTSVSPVKFTTSQLSINWLNPFRQINILRPNKPSCWSDQGVYRQTDILVC